jgi:3-hydroxyacyl-CoA dehydrogenase
MGPASSRRRVIEMNLAIAGTGAMARDIGAFLLGRGWGLTFLSRDADRLQSFQARMARDVRRIARDHGTVVEPAFGLVGGPDVARLLASVSGLLETIEERAESKKALFETLVPHLSPIAWILSNSSSYLPWSLHPGCLGSHFFRPVSLTGFLEVVVPAGADHVRVSRLCSLWREAGLHVILQDESSAFAVNRLLLPVQTECLAMLLAGASPEAVDGESARALGVGLLGMMDAIGLETVANAVEAYRSRMEPAEAATLEPLARGLSELLSMGKRGRPNGDGLLVGEPLPWAGGAGTVASDTATRLRTIFHATCRDFTGRGFIESADLRLVLDSLFGPDLHDLGYHADSRGKGR